MLGFLNYATEKVTTNAAVYGSAALENANYVKDVAAAKASDAGIT